MLTRHNGTYFMSLDGDWPSDCTWFATVDSLIRHFLKTFFFSQFRARSRGGVIQTRG